ncbi:hypothetical protein INR49_019962 [Caranx melampygus]|nr:hypothetical protein INR49_019962 [Caranx melampygus]
MKFPLHGALALLRHLLLLSHLAELLQQGVSMQGSCELAAQAQASLPGLDDGRRQRQVQAVQLSDVQRRHLLDLLHAGLHHHHAVAKALHLHLAGGGLHGDLGDGVHGGLLLARGLLLGGHGQRFSGSHSRQTETTITSDKSSCSRWLHTWTGVRTEEQLLLVSYEEEEEEEELMVTGAVGCSS